MVTGIKVDLHTHSVISPDGSLRLSDYQRVLALGKLDCVAVTDHNRTEFALELQRALGKGKVIVGEEISAKEGEIIGLYLTGTVPAGLSAADTVKAIKEQGGLVYIPHPFETVRSGIDAKTLDAIAANVDIVEIHNGRAVFQDKSRQASVWASEHDMPGAASSDAHGSAGWGKTYSVLEQLPTRRTLVELLKKATYRRGFPGLRGLSYPKYNRLRKKLKT